MQNPLNILIVDDEKCIRRTLAACLEADGHRVVSAESLAEGQLAAAAETFDLAFVDLQLGDDLGFDLVGPLLAANSAVEIIMMTANSSPAVRTESFRLGAAHFLSKPFTPDHVDAISRPAADRPSHTITLVA
jgi:DNA-binding response OmpR family regulator